MTVVFNYKHRLVGADEVKLGAPDKMTVGHRIRRGSEACNYFFLTFSDVRLQHFKYFRVAFCIHNVKTGIKSGKARKMYMSIGK